MKEEESLTYVYTTLQLGVPLIMACFFPLRMNKSFSPNVVSFGVGGGSSGSSSIPLCIFVLGLLWAGGGNSKIIEFIARKVGGDNSCGLTCPSDHVLYPKPEHRVSGTSFPPPPLCGLGIGTRI